MTYGIYLTDLKKEGGAGVRVTETIASSALPNYLTLYIEDAYISVLPSRMEAIHAAIGAALEARKVHLTGEATPESKQEQG